MIEIDDYWIKNKTYGSKDISLHDFTPQQIAQLVHELSALAWISVKDELPKYDGFYQVKDHNDDVFDAFFGGDDFDICATVTHWQPLAKVRK